MMDAPPAERPLALGAGAVPQAPVAPSGTQGSAIIAAASNPSQPTSVPKPISFSWLEPHPELVVILVGPDEIPFGLQKDFLCAKSSYYRDKFANVDGVEYVERLPNCPVEVFGIVQNFMYTGAVIPDDNTLPSYEILIRVWKLGHKRRIDGLCDHTLEAMVQVRQATSSVPSTPLLLQAWKDTPAGCSIRKLLLNWATDYIHTSDCKAEFARSLPQDILSELVVAMVPSNTSPLAQLSGDFRHPKPAHPRQKQVHYVDLDGNEAPESLYPVKKHRRFEPLPHATQAPKAVVRQPKALPPLPTPTARHRSNGAADGHQDFTTAQKLYFCSDLLSKMVSGPGFWPRLVRPFKEPVDAVIDNVPDYFEKVTKPMDLRTMKNKMDQGLYTSDEEFLADMNQIFTNCKIYWKPTDNVYMACEQLEKAFLGRYSQMNKWLVKLEGREN
ncbi:Bromodomain-containing protein [Diaporthe sp. PMI_573]|nr:Bromodomain-containing protein [Diaporthaceae sp. PMI_573]